ncbi:MAG: hypothetical protein AB8G96_01450 [Phycisphaerales bacterium]
MRRFQIRSDITRARIGDFALPLGLVPGDVEAPRQGYVLDYVTADEHETDSYQFVITVSHERLDDVLDALFGLLGGEVYPIIEIGSRDAYRAVDVWMAEEPMTRTQFLRKWRDYRDFLLEDGAISAGANSEEPAIEVFVDHWKGINLHVPLMLREDVEMVLARLDLEEQTDAWMTGEVSEDDPGMDARPVLDLSEPDLPDVEDLLLELRDVWGLVLNVDRERNVDDSGRPIGRTLWLALVMVLSKTDPGGGGYASVWITAGSLAEAEDFVVNAVEVAGKGAWRVEQFYSIDRVAYDERPDELSDLTPRRSESGVHLVQFDPWPEADGPILENRPGDPEP